MNNHSPPPPANATHASAAAPNHKARTLNHASLGALPRSPPTLSPSLPRPAHLD